MESKQDEGTRPHGTGTTAEQRVLPQAGRRVLLKFSIISLTLTVLATAASVWVIGTAVEHYLLDVTRHHNAERIERYIRPALDGSPVHTNAALAASIRDHILEPPLTGLLLQSADGRGTLQLGDPGALDALGMSARAEGAREEPSVVVVSPTGRQLVSRHEFMAPTGGLLRYYVVQDYEPLAAHIREQQVLAAATLAVFGLVLYALLFGVVRGAANALQREMARNQAAVEHVQATERRFRSLVQNSSDLILILDAAGRVTYVSPSVQKLLGTAPEAWLGASLAAQAADEDAGWLERVLPELSAELGEKVLGEVRLAHSDGSWRHFDVVGSNLLADPAVAGIVLNGRDVTERKTYEAQLTHQAFFDTLTSLPNRALFQDRLHHALDRAKRAGETVALMFLDLDRFKVVNDSLGHEAGDRLLIDVAARLQAELRPGDTFARLGGDEFTVLLDRIEQATDIRDIADRLQATMSLPFDIHGHEVFVGVSVGVAYSHRGQTDGTTLLRDADVALYRAKAEGRGRVVEFDPKSDAHSAERVDFEADLRRAIARNELLLVYQPVVDIRSMRVVGAEALIRWKHHERGLVSPKDFIPLAEETGIILDIGEWALLEACQEVRRWNETPGLPEGLIMNVNLSGKQFQRPDLLQKVQSALSTIQDTPGQIKLEITETVAMEKGAEAIEKFRQLKDLGVQLAIDDFGTGYSSLAYLQQMPVDTVKIDQSFVATLGDDDRSSAIVQTIAMLGHALGMSVTAEGVETLRQLDLLRSLGADNAQGYLFWKPLSADDFIRQVSDWQWQGIRAAA